MPLSDNAVFENLARWLKQHETFAFPYGMRALHVAAPPRPPLCAENGVCGCVTDTMPLESASVWTTLGCCLIAVKNN